MAYQDDMSATTETLPLSFISGFHEVRPLNQKYLDKLRSKIRDIGVKPYPLSVTPDGVLYGGRHRYEAFKAEGITECLMHIHRPDNLDREAIELNKASEDALPMTFVDYAELVWRRLDNSQTQQAVADGIGWSRAQVSQYAMLQKIDGDAWQVVATSFSVSVADSSDGDVANIATGVATPFTEGLLRNILDLCRCQQRELCRWLAKGKDPKGHKFGKADFKTEAERHRARNTLLVAGFEALAQIPDADALGYLQSMQTAIERNSEYVDEYLKEKKPGERFARLIGALIDDWQQKSNVQIIIKDIRLLTADDIPSGSVDVIITDPPYPADYIELFDALGALAARVLKPGGSLIAMTGQLYLPQYLAHLSSHLTYHWTLAYTTPGGQAVQVWNREVNTFWKPLLWFVNGSKDSRWVSDVINTPVNDNDKRHHHWGQGEVGMMEIVSRFSNQGDVVLDPFLGGGTTGVACKRLNRTFIGIDVCADVAEAAANRIHGDQG